LHPDIQNRDRNQLSRVGIAACGETGPAFLKRCKNRKQPFVEMRHRPVFHSLPYGMRQNPRDNSTNVSCIRTAFDSMAPTVPNTWARKSGCRKPAADNMLWLSF